MPTLDWAKFEILPGDVRDNFERVCRAATAHAYARYGRFAGVAQQPGVEFHLAVDQPLCPLGDPGRWFGWQTKWWDLPPGRAIGTTRRNDVEDSIRKTEQHVPGITDWFLWTRRPLTAGDQQWFYALNTNMRLHLWNETDLDERLIGDAALLREAYFGDLILTPERLADQHQRTAAESGERWIPQVHQAAAAERELRRMLAEPEAWDDLSVEGEQIERYVDAITQMAVTLPSPVNAEVNAITRAARSTAAWLRDVHTRVCERRTATLAAADWDTLDTTVPANPSVLRRLRALQHPVALPMTNLVAHLQTASWLAEELASSLTTRVAVVSGDAGYGKTQLAATLSAASESRPAGVLLYGRLLATRHTLDDLARQVTVAGAPLNTFEALLAAVNAAAERAGTRLPIVIDGLNEAETATTWQPLLRSLLVTLERYPSVLVVCTVREAFLDDAIPAEIPEHLTLDGFDEDLPEAIARYFAYYKIEAGDAELPLEILNHPLTLKIYCSVANPDRTRTVGVERLPATLTGMFDQYVTITSRRIFELHPAIHPRDVTLALDKFGQELWDTRARDVPEPRARELFGDTGRLWQNTLLSALEQEGLLIRHPGGSGDTTVALVYDRFAGHVIATSLLHARGAGIEAALASDEYTALFAGHGNEVHPLAVDTFDELAGSMPRNGARQLWQVVDESLRHAALLRATQLEADYIDSATVGALIENIDRLRGRPGDILDRLYSTRAATRHPLNATFLDQILRNRSVADRDLRWTEWLRANARRLREDAHDLITRWRGTPVRTEADWLRARWLTWTLTSTNRHLRDAATAALYWYGRGDADGLFALALDALTVNDAYVAERVLAAAYGVTTTKQLADPTFEASLSTYLAGLHAALAGDQATDRTSHALLRYYAAGTVQFADRFYPGALPPNAPTPWTFAAGPPIEPLPDGDPRRLEVRTTAHMDFRNYTLGRLFRDRANYDDNHPEYQQALAQIFGVVHTLGWRADRFADVDRSIANQPRYRQNLDQVERYGKKYAWIGLYTVAGVLADGGQPPEWLEVDIDPTFPDPPPPAPVRLPSWSRRTPANERRWLRHGVVTVPDTFLAPTSLDGDDGPWMLVHAELEHKDVATGRQTFGLINTVLVDRADLDDFLHALSEPDHPGRDAIDVPADYYVFAGEVAWNARFAAPPDGDSLNDVYTDDLRRWERRHLRFERLTHHLAWESHHSSENQVTGYVPSRLLSEAFDLRSVPAGLDQVEPTGALASRSFAAPDGFEGDLLYVRSDLVTAYAGDRAIVTFAWGERQTQFAWPEEPSPSLQKLYQAGDNVWRTVKEHG